VHVTRPEQTLSDSADLSDNQLDLILSALADGNRRKMILSMRTGAKTVESLAQPLGITTWGAMKHLHILEESGLVTSEKRGRSRYCQLRPERLETVTLWIQEIQSFWTGNLERLIQLVEEEK